MKKINKYLSSDWLWMTVNIEPQTSSNTLYFSLRSYKKEVRKQLIQFKDRIVNLKPLSLILVFNFRIQNSLKKRDLDNLVKPVIDTLENFVFKGKDNLIKEVYAIKQKAKKDSIEIGIKTYSKPLIEI